jgi:hypothetical protein
MNFQQARWTAERLNELTWTIAQYRVWAIILITLAGVVTPLLKARGGGKPLPTPSMCIHSGGAMLAFSSAVAAVSSLLHFSDLRWLPPGQRGALHVSTPGGILGNIAKPVVTAVNSVAGIPAEWRAAQMAIHTAVVCAFLALVGYLLVVLSRRHAQRAEIQLLVREQTNQLEARLQQAESRLGLR